MAHSTEPKLYAVWKSMLARCQSTKNNRYAIYGGRGIKVCDRWLSFENFIGDMRPSYQEGLSLERIDNDSGYSKENCCWATSQEQANNRRTNTLLTIKGETKTLAQWCRLSKVKYSTIRQRYYVYNWPIEKALSI